MTTPRYGLFNRTGQLRASELRKATRQVESNTRIIPGHGTFLIQTSGGSICATSPATSETTEKYWARLGPVDPLPQTSGSTEPIGGTIPDGSYYLLTTYSMPTGEELAATASSAIEAGGGNLSTLTINSPLSRVGASGWFAYVGTNSSGPFHRQGGENDVGTDLTIDEYDLGGVEPPPAPTQLRRGFTEQRDAAETGDLEDDSSGRTTLSTGLYAFEVNHQDADVADNTIVEYEYDKGEGGGAGVETKDVHYFRHRGMKLPATVATPSTGGTISADSYYIYTAYHRSDGTKTDATAFLNLSVNFPSPGAKITIQPPASDSQYDGWYAYVRKGHSGVYYRQDDLQAFGTALVITTYDTDGQTDSPEPGSGFECWYPAGMLGFADALLGSSPLGNEPFDIPDFSFGNGWILLPFLSVKGGTMDRMGVYVSAVGSGLTDERWRLAIWDSISDTDLYPNALLTDAGHITLNANGLVAAEISVTLTGNKLYWFGFCSRVTGGGQAISPKLRGFGQSGQCWSPLGLGPDFRTQFAIIKTFLDFTFPADPFWPDAIPFNQGDPTGTTNGGWPYVAVRLAP